MKGILNKVDTKKKKDGSDYYVLEIDGKMYSSFDQKVEKYWEGMEVEFEYKQKGKYNNITSIAIPDYDYDEVNGSMPPKQGSNRMMELSYKKDLFICMLERISQPQFADIAEEGFISRAQLVKKIIAELDSEDSVTKEQ